MSKGSCWFTRCAVTGGNGFLGTHLVQQLLAAGTKVVTTVRKPVEDKVAHLRRLKGAKEGLTINDLDLMSSSQADFASAFQGCDVLFHTASPFFYNVKDGQKELVEPALEGTKKVLTAAKNAGVRFVVVTSSVAAVSAGVQPQDPVKGYGANDWSPADKLRGWNAWYPLSKTLAEKAAWSVAEQLELPICTICPCQIFGPLLQPKVNTSSQKILDLLNGKPARIPNTNMTYVDVRDVAALHMAAAQAKASTKRIMAVAGAFQHRHLCDILRAAASSSSVPLLVDGDAEDGSELATPPGPAARWDTSEATTLGILFRKPEDTFTETVRSLQKSQQQDKNKTTKGAST